MRTAAITFSPSKSSGFTILEMVLTIVLIGIIAGMLAPFIRYNVEGFATTQILTDLTNRGRVAMERLTREIREADPNPSTIQISAPDNLQFKQLQNLSGVSIVGGTVKKTYQACRDVNVYKQGNSLVWDEGADGSIDAILTDDVSSLSFTYAAGTAMRSGVVTVRMTLSDPNNTESVDFYREIHIRNTIADIAVCP